MEELILRYYLKIFSIITLIFLLNFYFVIFVEKRNARTDIIEIKKNESFENIIKKNLKDVSKLELFYFKTFYYFFIKLKSHIHFGNFYLDKDFSIYNFLNKISKPSNILNKFTVIEGMNKYDLSKKINNSFNIEEIIDYDLILADTYFYNKNENLKKLIKKMKKNKDDFFRKYENNNIFEKYSIKEIMIIGSLIEKEGLDYFDKKNIFSVIINRLNKKMRLQIDATVIYAITEGKYNLSRKLNINDLKYDHLYNTYKIFGLPPEPISYVGTKTIELMLENYNTDYLFYFYNEKLKKHIFTKTYKEHLKLLNEYRLSK